MSESNDVVIELRLLGKGTYSEHTSGVSQTEGGLL